MPGSQLGMLSRILHQKFSWYPIKKDIVIDNMSNISIFGNLGQSFDNMLRIKIDHTQNMRVMRCVSFVAVEIML